MCGISAVVIADGSAARKAVEILKAQEHRGRLSAGIAFASEKEVKVLKSLGSPSDFASKNEEFLGSCGVRTVIGHNRMPSRGEVSVQNAHPFRSCDGKFALVHNGTEHAELLKAMLKEKHRWQGETDSEIVMHALEELVARKGMRKAMQVLAASLHGSFLVLTDAGELYGFGDNLYILLEADAVYIASETDSFIPLFEGQKKTILHPEDETVFKVTAAGKVFYWGKLERTKEKLEKKVWSAPAGGYQAYSYNPATGKFGVEADAEPKLPSEFESELWQEPTREDLELAGFGK